MGNSHQLSENNIEMHTIGDSGTRVEAERGGYSDTNDKCDAKEDEDTELSPALTNYYDHTTNLTESRRPKIVGVIFLVLVACLALVMVVAHFHGNNGSDLFSNTQIYGDQQQQQHSQESFHQEEENVDNIIYPTSSSSSSSHTRSKIVEFTVANLNTNNCTYIPNSHDLHCTPQHDTTSTNKFRIMLHPEWAPIGVERFESLTASNFWRGVRIFRVVPNFIVQFGISSKPEVQKSWSSLGPISDDPVMASNVRGYVTFATSGPNSRTTQIFINTNDNSFLDEEGFAPIGEVLSAGNGYGGMSVVDGMYSNYYEKPDQWKIEQEGEVYLNKMFPLLSYFVNAEFVEE